MNPIHTHPLLPLLSPSSHFFPHLNKIPFLPTLTHSFPPSHTPSFNSFQLLPTFTHSFPSFPTLKKKYHSYQRSPISSPPFPHSPIPHSKFSTEKNRALVFVDHLSRRVMKDYRSIGILFVLNKDSNELKPMCILIEK